MNTDKLLIELANYMDEEQNKKQRKILDELSDCQNPAEKYAEFSEYIKDEKTFNQIVNSLQPFSEEALEPIENVVIELVQNKNQQKKSRSVLTSKLYDLAKNSFHTMLSKKVMAGMGTAFASIFLIALFNWSGLSNDDMRYQMEISGNNQEFRSEKTQENIQKKFYRNNQMTVVLRPEKRTSGNTTCRLYLYYRDQLTALDAQVIKAKSGAFKSLLNFDSLNLMQSGQYALVAIIAQNSQQPSIDQIKSELDGNSVNSEWQLVRQDFQYINL